MCTAEIFVTVDNIALKAKFYHRKQRNVYLDLHVNYRIIYLALNKPGLSRKIFLETPSIRF